MHANELEAAIDHARDFDHRSCLDPHSEETFEGLAIKFAELSVQLADACVIGVPCKKHVGAMHGREAEELRRGIEKLLAADLDDYPYALRELLDEIDARDSLAFREAADSK